MPSGVLFYEVVLSCYPLGIQCVYYTQLVRVNQYIIYSRGILNGTQKLNSPFFPQNSIESDITILFITIGFISFKI